MFCTKCGAKSDNGDAFCGECGAPINYEQSDPLKHSAVNNAERFRGDDQLKSGDKNMTKKLDLWRIQDQVRSNGDAILLTGKDVMPLKLMYITADVMDGGSVQLDQLLAKYGYNSAAVKSFEGYLIIGEVKGRHLYAEKIIDFKQINGMK